MTSLGLFFGGVCLKLLMCSSDLEAMSSRALLYSSVYASRLKKKRPEILKFHLSFPQRYLHIINEL